MNETLAQRLRQARVRANLSLQELCEKVNGMAKENGWKDTTMTRQAISNYEQGLRMPSDKMLLCLSQALRQSVEFFFTPMRFERKDVSISYKRSYTNIGVLNAMEENVLDEVERHLEIDDLLGEEKMNFDKVTAKRGLATKEDMLDCAKRVREEWGLSNAPIKNTQLLLWKHGIEVIMFDGPEEFEGLCVTVEGRPMVVLNRKVEKVEKRRITAMHELAHILFNDKFDKKLSEKERENLCQEFASEMLLPEEVLRKRCAMKQNVSLTELFFLQALYGIAVEDLLSKMRGMGLITEKRYRTFAKLRKNSMIQRAIDRPRFTEGDVSMFEDQVYRALARGIITINKAASLLNTSEQVVRENLSKI